jgi:alpha-glucosidase
MLVYGAHPANILKNPCVEIVKSIPSVWDETIALPVSEIGEIAAFARRRRNTWFLAILNGPDAKSVKVPLTFLGNGTWRALMARDSAEDAAAVKIENAEFERGAAVSIDLRAGGGFIARFTR